MLDVISIHLHVVRLSGYVFQVVGVVPGDQVGAGVRLGVGQAKLLAHCVGVHHVTPLGGYGTVLLVEALLMSSNVPKHNPTCESSNVFKKPS